MSITQGKERLLLLFLGGLTLINLIQGSATQLIFDEAYYWYFSQHPAWGYFDHPPMVAFFAAIGTTLFDHELGVRLFAPFLLSGTICLLWKLIDDKRKYDHLPVFILFTASVALFNAYGFFMLPDTPLLFFSALFLFAYKRFLQYPGIRFVLLLGFSMAAMMYSKYHAILLIAFVLVSNPKIFLSYRFWMATVFALLLYTPHLYWLYETDFASLKYHLSGRANSYYRIKFTLDYILNALIVWGFSFPLIYWALYKFTLPGGVKKNVFDRALVFSAWGILGFFLLSSFNRKTQAQWPLLAVLPFIVFTFRYALDKERFRKWLRITSIISLVILCMVRVIVVDEDISPIKYESHGNKRWAQQLYEKTGGLPVVFEDSYRNASMYGFYARVPVYSLNSVKHRQNQYDIDSSEYKFQHRRVAYITGREDYDSVIKVRIGKGKGHPWRGKFVKDFRSFRKLICKVDDHKITPGKDSIALTLINPYTEGIAFEDLEFYGLVLNEKRRIQDTIRMYPGNTGKTKVLTAGSTIHLNAGMDRIEKLEEGVLFRVAISEFGYPSGFQGDIIPIAK